MSFQFSNVVIVDRDKVGVIVKSWGDGTYDVYVRSYNNVTEYEEKDISHFVYDKELEEPQ